MNSSATTAKRMPETLRLSLILGIIAFGVSLVLALVNAVTAPIIAQNADSQVNKSLAVMFPQADDFAELELVPAGPLTGGYSASSGGVQQGLIMMASPTGYGGEIEMMIGFDLEGRVVGITFLSMAETAGIGTKVTQEDYWSRFIGLREFSAVDGISGATISATAVKSGVTAAADAAAEWLQLEPR